MFLLVSLPVLFSSTSVSIASGYQNVESQHLPNNLFDIWANNAKWNGAVLMSSVLTTGKGDLVTLGEVYADSSVPVNLELYAIQFPKPQKEVYYHIGYCMITEDLV